jgi:hypothetical protein
MNPASFKQRQEINPAPFTLRYSFVAERCWMNTKICGINMVEGAG